MENIDEKKKKEKVMYLFTLSPESELLSLIVELAERVRRLTSGLFG